MDRRMAADLDRYITGNYGEDQFRDDIPEEAYHQACNGEGCAECNNTGIDPVKLKENIEANKAADDELYQDWIESLKHE